MMIRSVTRGLLAALLLAGCGDGFVGGACAEGFEERDGACVAPAADACGGVEHLGDGGAGGEGDIDGSGGGGADPGVTEGFGGQGGSAVTGDET